MNIEEINGNNNLILISTNENKKKHKRKYGKLWVKIRDLNRSKLKAQMIMMKNI